MVTHVDRATERSPLASLLHERREELLQRWTRRVLADRQVPEAGDLSEDALRDHFPQLLAELEGALAEGPPDEAGGDALGDALGREGAAREHARGRSARHYTLRAALRELSHLREALLELCDAEGVPFEGRDARLIHAALDESMTVAASEIERAAQAAEAKLRRERADLQAREDRVRLAVEAAQVGTWDLDLGSGELHWDARCKAIFGLPPDAAVSYSGTFLPGMRPADRDRVAKAVAQAIDPTSEGTFVAEYRVIDARDGAERWVLARGRRVTDDRGQAWRLIGTISDITEHRRAEEAAQVLAEASAALASSLDYESTLKTVARLVVAHLADYCLIDLLDEGGRPRRIELAARDPAGEALLRRAEPHAPSLTPGSPFGEVVATRRPLLVTQVTPGWLDRMASDPTYREVLEGLAPVSAMLVPLLVRGRVIGVIKLLSSDPARRYDERDMQFAEDLGRRAALAVDNARLYREAREALATLDTFITSAPVGFALLDRELRYVRINETLAAMNGRPVEAHLGRLMREAVPEVSPETEAMLRRVLETGEPILNVEHEVEVPSHPGERRHLLGSYYPVREPDGAIDAVGGVVTDITERRRIEDELRHEAAFRERFLGILGHDLRTPLSAVTLSASTLTRHGGLGESQQRAAARILTSARRMERMIRDLLDFTRSRHRGGIPVAPQPADLRAIARAVLDEVHASQPDREVRLDVKGDARGEWDPDRLAQVVSNLVVNALDYSPEETPVDVTVRGDDATVVVAVHNQGPPIAPEVRAILFDPFRRGKRASTSGRASRGLGLGLFIVEQIVRAHGGAITVASDEHGTTFSVSLPRRAPQASLAT